MSSSSEVRLAYLAEATYGTTPATGAFSTLRFNSESLSGTPTAVQSQEIRSDRQPTGQINTGLTVGGDVQCELTPDVTHEDMILAAMMATGWSSKVTSTATGLSIAATGTLFRVSATTYSFATNGYEAQDLVQLTGFAAANNKFAYITTVSGTDLIVAATGLTATAGSGDESVVRHAYAEIGTTNRSFSVEKNFQDLTTKTISFTGMRVGSANFNFAFGQLASVDFGFAGNGHATPSAAMTTGHTVTAAGSESPLNGTDDMSFVVEDSAIAPFCIQSLAVNLNNNLQPTNCIGQSAPTNQVTFQASVGVNMTAYLDDDNFDYIGKKINDTSVGVHFPVVNSSNEGYAVSIPAVQLTFQDPGAAGLNQHVMLNMSGQAKYDSTFGNTLRIYKVTQS